MHKFRSVWQKSTAREEVEEYAGEDIVDAEKPKRVNGGSFYFSAGELRRMSQTRHYKGSTGASAWGGSVRSLTFVTYAKERNNGKL